VFPATVFGRPSVLGAPGARRPRTATLKGANLSETETVEPVAEPEPEPDEEPEPDTEDDDEAEQ
jgi:hypothetical protein